MRLMRIGVGQIRQDILQTLLVKVITRKLYLLLVINMLHHITGSH